MAATDVRQACDRCHDKKLRCPKPPGAVSCGRCTKAGAQCTFSPPTRATARYDTSTRYQQSPSLAWPEMMGLDQTHGFALLSGAADLPNYFAGFPSPMQTERVDGGQGDLQDNNTSYASCPNSDSTAGEGEIEQLADIMVSLSSASRNLPSHRLYHVSKQQVHQWTEDMSQMTNIRAGLESLLSCAQRLTASYPTVLKAAVLRTESSNLVDTCHVPDCLHGDGLVQECMTGPLLDHALLNLLLACHLKLLDILEALVAHSTVCGHVTGHMPKDQLPTFNIPDVRIGSFVAPKDAAPFMLISVIVELQVDLVSKSEDLASLASSPEAPTRETQVLSLQCEILRDRTRTMLDRLIKLKGDMGARSLMR